MAARRLVCELQSLLLPLRCILGMESALPGSTAGVFLYLLSQLTSPHLPFQRLFLKDTGTQMNLSSFSFVSVSAGN